jgi:hypothetical protein
MEGNRSRGRGPVSSGLLTGLSTAAVSGSAAAAGIILSRKFGHGVKTDGFFAAYAVYLVMVLVASALRVIVLPRFVRPRLEGRLAGEVGTWLAALAVPVLPVVAFVLAWAHGVAGLLAGRAQARDAAAVLLPWLAAAAAAQIAAGVVSSALAACDDYVNAAVGFTLGAVAGVVVILLTVDHGVVAFGWGLAANGAIALAVPLQALVRRRGIGLPDQRPLRRLAELVDGVALPFALQGLYLVGYRYAVGLGTGRATTFSYAYLIAAFLVAVTATSIALVATVPFAREETSSARVARHVTAIAWLSLVAVAAAAGVFALAGASVVQRVLGSSYSGGTGAELGRLVVYLAPWTVASIALSVSFPLVFVGGRARWLPPLAVAAVAAQVLVEWAARALFGLAGIAVGLGVTTAGVLVVLLLKLNALAPVAKGMALAVLACGGVALPAFLLPRVVVGPVAAAAAGLALYAVALALWRPAGLRHAWEYVRALE